MRSLLFLLLGIVATGCGPAATDGEYSISGANDYAFSDAGGDGKFITRRRAGKPSEITIRAKVVAFRVENNRLLVLRQPASYKTRTDGTLHTVLEAKCELWAINTLTHDVQLMARPLEAQSCTENLWPAIKQ